MFSPKKPAIQFENTLSQAILQEASQNHQVKDHLQTVADDFKKNLLAPLKEAVKDQKTLADIPLAVDPEIVAINVEFVFLANLIEAGSNRTARAIFSSAESALNAAKGPRGWL